jgi:hypothetical protein
MRPARLPSATPHFRNVSRRAQGGSGVARRRELEAAIDEAIRTSAFTLVYQPIVVLGRDEMVGVEAPGVQRARWQSHGAGVSATRGETEKTVRRTAGDSLAGRSTGQ